MIFYVRIINFGSVLRFSSHKVSKLEKDLGHLVKAMHRNMAQLQLHAHFPNTLNSVTATGQHAYNVHCQ